MGSPVARGSESKLVRFWGDATSADATVVPMAMRAMRGCAPVGRVLARGFHFGSPSYHAAFLPGTVAAREPLRAAALAALDESHGDHRKEMPVASLLDGKTLGAGAMLLRGPSALH